jgi:uncharacterized protein involved in outer membrane biogenesis
MTLTNGKLSAPFRAKLSGAAVDGQIQLTREKNVPGVSLKATIGKIDAGQTLKRLKLPDIIAGSADALDLDGSSQGKTLRAWLEGAAFTLQIKPANLRYTAQMVDVTLDFTFQSAKFVARRDSPVTVTLSGTLQGDPFNATISAGKLSELQRTDVPLPVRLAIQTEDLEFKAEGTIARPFEKKEIDLTHVFTGKEIQGVAPLLDLAVPLKGAFRAEGRTLVRSNHFTWEEDMRVGKSDLQMVITVLRRPTRPKITGRIFAQDLHLNDLLLFEADAIQGDGSAPDRTRVIPNYTIPVDLLLTADLDLDIQAEHIRAGLVDLGDLVSNVTLNNGQFKTSLSMTGFKGAQISGAFDINAAAQPPLTQVQLTAKDINFGFLLTQMEVTDFIEGHLDLFVDLTGFGATRYEFLGNADGRITLIGGPGRITGRRIDLWAADLIPTMLSPRWQREDVTDMNCIVAHIGLKEGVAEIEDLMLDTQRITIAGSGVLNLETEALDLLIAPRPKRASLVSLANPVTIRGTLSEPEVSVARIPRRRRLAGTGILAGLINPAFLLFSFSDTGTGQANPCASAVESAQEAAEADSQ